MLTRRDFLQVAAASAALGNLPCMLHAAARQAITQDALLQFEELGQVTLLHVTDMHAQLMPLYFREPSVNLGVGEAHGKPPHITGRDFLEHFGLEAGGPQAYAFTSLDYTALARSYGRIGGVDRLATLVKAIRAERPTQTLLLDGGDTWQGSYTALKTGAEDMVGVMNALCIEGLKYDIRVNTLAPAAATRMTEELMSAEVLEQLKPEYVTPGVLYLVSEEGPNRCILSAGAGSFARMVVRETAGHWLSPEERTPEGVAANWDKITDESAMVEPQMAGEQTAKLLQLAAKELGLDLKR